MVQGETGQELVETVEILLVVDHGYACPDTGLVAAGGTEADGGTSVLEQFLLQLVAAESRITDGEEESVGNRTVTVHVVDYMEIIALEDLLDYFGTTAIFAAVCYELQFSA